METIKRIFYILCLLTIAIPSYSATVIFKTGFENDAAMAASRSSSVWNVYDEPSPTCTNNPSHCDHGAMDDTEGYNWSADLPGDYRVNGGTHPPRMNLVIDGDHYICETSTDQVKNGNKSLKIQTNMYASSGRVQLVVRDTSDGETYDNFDTFCWKYWLYIDTTSIPTQTTSWFMVAEWRTNGEGTLQLFIDDLKTGDPRWHWQIDDTDNYRNPNIPVPLNQWFEIIIYYEYGSSGNFIMKTKTTTGEEQSIFNMVGVDTRSDTGSGIYVVMPIKHYGMRGFPIYYDDFTWYSTTSYTDIPDWDSGSPAFTISNKSHTGQTLSCGTNPLSVNLSWNSSNTANFRIDSSDPGSYAAATPDSVTNTDDTNHSVTQSFACGASYTRYIYGYDTFGQYADDTLTFTVENESTPTDPPTGNQIVGTFGSGISF